MSGSAMSARTVLALMALSASTSRASDAVFALDEAASTAVKKKVIVIESPKMPLSEEEILKLDSLHGKEKKKYVKELKQKYQSTT